MKYRGIELKKGNGFESELAIGVQLLSRINIKNLEKEIIDMSINNKYSFYTEIVLDNYLLVRSNDISFDNDGIKILKDMYSRVNNIAYAYDGTVLVDVHLDEWFISKNGEKYNNDQGMWGEFIDKLNI